MPILPALPPKAGMQEEWVGLPGVPYTRRSADGIVLLDPRRLHTHDLVCGQVLRMSAMACCLSLREHLAWLEQKFIVPCRFC